MGFAKCVLSVGVIGTFQLWRLKKRFSQSFIDSIRVDEKADISPKARIAHDAEIRGNVSIGRWTYVEPYSFINSATVGKFCAIGRNVAIGGFQHPYRYPTISPKIYRGILGTSYEDPSHKIEIGNDVWIGEKAIILEGKIGDGAIIAAGAVVTKDVEPYAIVAGVPAKKIGDRFNEEQKSKLLNLKWWNWSDEEIIAHRDFFESREKWEEHYDTTIAE